ncbi:MAG: hypothetical protein VX438_09655 [Planctomycetota bacterium]|nr:hypothetical protein [Planctomycetota bacterium]
MSTKRDRLKIDSLVREMKIGLLGSPYDWNDVDFDRWKKAGIELCLIGLPGTIDANQQDLLVQQESGVQPSDSIMITQNQHSVLDCDVTPSQLSWINPDVTYTCFQECVDSLNQKLLEHLKRQEDKYVGTDAVIATYGAEVIRAGSLLCKPQIHIENEALGYLVEVPWRNCQELEYVISRMVFYLEGDVLRKPYVQEFVYELGTSIRGISNSSVADSIIQSFTYDVLNRFDFQTTSQLLKVQLDQFRFYNPFVHKSVSNSIRKDAA